MRSLCTVTGLMLIAVLAGGPAQAEEYRPIHDRKAFLSVVEGRALRIALYDLTLRVGADGAISGRALGGEVSGKWQWSDGYFCRTMEWAGRKIDADCQLVEQRGTSALRFTSGKGSGKRAVFRLQ